jgi:hypothetical protein
VKTIDVKTQSPQMTSLLQQAREDALILRLEDGSEFLLVAVDEFDHEIARARQNKDLMAFLEARARREAAVPIEEVKRRLGIDEGKRSKP